MLVPCVIYIAACSDSGWGGAYWEFSHISYFLAPYTSSSLSQNSWLPKSTYFSLEIYFWVCFFFKRCPSLLYHEVSELESRMITPNYWMFAILSQFIPSSYTLVAARRWNWGNISTWAIKIIPCRPFQLLLSFQTTSVQDVKVFSTFHIKQWNAVHRTE